MLRILYVQHFKSRLVAAAFSFLVVLSCRAFGTILQPEYPVYNIAHYTTENGLPQNTVKSIVRDEHGFLWLVTESGLVRFDGNRFVTFDKSTLGLRNQRFLNIQTSLDSNNKFYVCTDSYEYLAVKNGRPYIYPYEKLLKKISPYATKGIDNFYITAGIPRLLSNMFYPRNFIVPGGGDGNYYRLTNSCVHVFRNWREEVSFKNEGRNFWDYFRKGDKLFYLNENGDFSYFDKEGRNKKLTLAGDILKDKLIEKGQRKFEILLNDIADQLIIAIGKSIYLVTFHERERILQTRLLVNDFDCEEKDICTVHYDQKSGRLFLGSRSDGLFVLSKRIFIALTYGSSRRENVYYGQMNFDKDEVLTSQGVLLGLISESGKVIDSLSSKWEKRKSEDIATGYLRDKKGYIWSKKKNWLYKRSSNGKELINKWVYLNDLGHIYSADGKNLWIATKKAGLYAMDADQGIPDKLLDDDMTLPRIEFMQLESPDKLWVGLESGLFWIDRKSKKRNYVKAFEGIHVRSIYIPSEGEIWVSTYEHGLWLVKGKKITKFPLDDNKYLSGIHCIVEDRNCFFWLPTNKGLFQVAREELIRYHNLTGKKRKPFYFYYARESGFNTNEFNGGCQPCAVRTGNDYVSLPSMNGLVWFRPEGIERELPGNKIFVDGYKINDNFYYAESDTLDLPLDLSSLDILVTTPYYGNSGNVNIDYVLYNENRSFTLKGRLDMTMESPALSLSHLPGGIYKLEFKLANGSEVNPFTKKELVIISPLHHYETVYFRVIAFLLFCFSVLFLIFYRTRRIEKRNERLEQLVSQRTEELQNTLSVLLNTEKELEGRISQQSGIIASISHDINTPLRYHTLLVEHSKKLLKDRDLEGLEIVHETLGFSTSQLTTLTNNLLEYIKVQTFESMHSDELVMLYDIVHQKVELFKPILKVRHNRFVNDLAVSVQVRSNPVLLGIIIHNLLDNAYKFTYQGIIRITAEHRDKNTILTIHNTQGGMSAETIEWLTAQTKDLPQSSISKNGLGLLIVKEMAAIVNIRIVAKSTETETSISLWFSDNVTSTAVEDNDSGTNPSDIV